MSNKYIFGQCKNHSNRIPKDTVLAWIYEVNKFKKKEGYAYEKLWPYKNTDTNSIANTSFYFCTVSDIESGGVRELNSNNIQICYLDYLAYMTSWYHDKIFDEKNNLIIKSSIELLTT